jgi:dephospho-CoA kinase
VNAKKVLLIGLAGGIASGKSMIAQQFGQAGAVVISADALAHEVLEYDEVKRAVRERFGDRAFAADGRVDRKALAQIVFAPGPEAARQRAYLEHLIHPEVGRLARQRIEEIGRAGTAAAVVLDVPLLFESGWNHLCDRIVYVDAPRAQRLARALARGWTEEEFDRREATQQSLVGKQQRADLVIDNSGSPQQAQVQVEQFWRELTAAAHAG